MDNSQLVSEKIIKARVKLQTKSPFFSYLSLHLKPQEFSKEIEEYLIKKGQTPTMGVDKYSNLYYSPNFVNSLSTETLMSVLAHECLHLCLGHFFRMKRQSKESPDGCNIAMDSIINRLLILNGFNLDQIKEGAIIPGDDDVLRLGKKPNEIIIEDISKKTSEEIYEELMKQAKDKNMIKYVPFDNHLMEQGEGEEGRGNSKSDKELEKEWKKRIIEAKEHSKHYGKTPLGMNRYIDELLEEKVNWRQILQQQIKAEIVNDYTWKKRSKRSIATGFYLPSTKKENAEVSIVIDLSGSIGQEDLKDFLSEVVGMSRQFQSNLKMKLITHQTKVDEVYEINQANRDKILNLKLSGGGGTSAIPVIEYLNENVKGNELVVWLTDGYFEDVNNEEFRFRPLWILSRDSSEESIKNTGRIIKLYE